MDNRSLLYDTAESLNNLALLHNREGKYAEAEPLLMRVLSISEQQLGLVYPNTARCLNNLATLYSSQGKYGEAETLYHCAHVAEKTLLQG